MHGDPHVPNDGRAGPRLPLKPGLVIAIEPWFLQTTDEIYTDRRRLDAAQRATAHAARTWSTPWRSPTTATLDVLDRARPALRRT